MRYWKILLWGCLLVPLQMHAQSDLFDADGPDQLPLSDTLTNQKGSEELPPFEMRVYDLAAQSYVDYQEDSLSLDLFRMERIWQYPFLGAHLGHELTSQQAIQPWRITERLDLQLWRNRNEVLYQPSKITTLYKPNRAYWDIQYQKGYTLNASGRPGNNNLHVDFFRSFNRGIYFNFEYDYGKEDNINSNTNAATLHDINVKVFQHRPEDAKSTYVLFRSLRHDELFDGASDFELNSARQESKTLHFVAGHQWAQINKDSTSQSYWYAEAAYQQSQYAIAANGLDTTSTRSFGLTNSTIDARLQQTTWSGKLGRRAKIWDWNGDISLGVDYHTIQNSGLVNSVAAWRIRSDFKRQWANSLRGQVKVTLGQNMSLADDTEALTALFPNELVGQASFAIQRSGAQHEWQLTASVEKLPQAVTNRFFALDTVSFSYAEALPTIEKAGMELQYQYQKTGTSLTATVFRARQMALPTADFGIPEVFSDHVISYGVQLRQPFEIWGFRTWHSVLWQNDGSERWIFPNWQLRGNIMYPFHLFSEKLAVQLGADYAVMSESEVPSFHPIWASYYQSDNTNGLNAPSFLVTPYMVLRRDRFTLFFKTNLYNAFWERQLFAQENDFQMVQNFSARTPKWFFGVRWTLLD